MGSGEHRLELADTDPAPPPDDPETKIPTWPKLRAVRLELETDLLTGEDQEP